MVGGRAGWLGCAAGSDAGMSSEGVLKRALGRLPLAGLVAVLPVYFLAALMVSIVDYSVDLGLIVAIFQAPLTFVASVVPNLIGIVLNLTPAQMVWFQFFVFSSIVLLSICAFTLQSLKPGARKRKIRYLLLHVVLIVATFGIAVPFIAATKPMDDRYETPPTLVKRMAWGVTAFVAFFFIMLSYSALVLVDYSMRVSTVDTQVLDTGGVSLGGMQLGGVTSETEDVPLSIVLPGVANPLATVDVPVTSLTWSSEADAPENDPENDQAGVSEGGSDSDQIGAPEGGQEGSQEGYRGGNHGLVMTAIMTGLSFAPLVLSLLPMLAMPVLALSHKLFVRAAAMRLVLAGVLATAVIVLSSVSFGL